jgi:hypothetical protein
LRPGEIFLRFKGRSLCLSEGGAKWVDRGDNTIYLQALHETEKATLELELCFGETITPGQVLKVGGPGGFAELRQGTQKRRLEGELRAMETDGWTFVKFAGDGCFQGTTETFTLSGWYSGLRY